MIAGTFNRGGIVLCCGVGLVMFLQSDAEYSSRCRATTSVRSLPLPQINPTCSANHYHDLILADQDATCAPSLKMYPEGLQNITCCKTTIHDAACTSTVQVGLRLPQNDLIRRERYTWAEGTGETDAMAVCRWMLS